MVLIVIQHESSNVEDCVNMIRKKSIKELASRPGKITKSKISLSFGAFMNLRLVLTIDNSLMMDKGVIVEYSTGKNKEEAIKNIQNKINSYLKYYYQIVDFEFGTYTTPVTRRTYAVGVVVYNVPRRNEESHILGLKERREILARALELFNYNPKALNISELARMFKVSRDSIYYDIEQILKEKGKS
ncbi:hypothetical protein PAP_03685 [Palaeococcus pacificus DY20341]|uniref:Helix-turn-helix type 11 domain-containing protein n=1 Tax=Palaeococcus pacificus DY20341 TaxID=1343739 RepID=A0A075LT83_9EURY|nr:hypothetical protein [Palaeococcus pacificus]AIF69157.1 hypothetical protein PAP_03685 [Palaeococcus pacificus DY20341]